MGKSSTKSKQQQLARDQSLIVGIPKRMSSAQMLVEGTTYTAITAVALLQGRVTAATSAVTARAAYQAAVKAADVAESTTAATVRGLVEVIYAAFGDDPAALADFGLPVRKTGVMTPAQRIVAEAKAKATRAARHTMGPKQKALITGATLATSTPPAAVPVGSVPPATATTPAPQK
jgi:hypothetical protein